MKAFALSALFLFFQSQFTYAQGGFDSFFSSHGDDNFFQMTDLQAEQYCLEFDCRLIEKSFHDIENDLNSKDISDQKVALKLARLSHKEFDLSKASRNLKKEFSYYSHLNAKSLTRFEQIKQKDKPQEALDLFQFNFLSLLKLSQKLGYIDSVHYLILHEAYQDLEAQSFHLRRYQNDLQYIKESAAFEFSSFSDLNSKTTREKISALKTLSSRQRLYTIYNKRQISLLSSVLERGIEVIQAGRADITVKSSEGKITHEIPLSSQEKYRFALKLILRDFHRLQNDPQFSEISSEMELIDLLSAGLETGVISGQVVNELMGGAALNILPGSFWERHSKMAISLAKTGALLMPGGGAYVLVGIILAESFFNRGDKSASQKIDHLF